MLLENSRENYLFGSGIEAVKKEQHDSSAILVSMLESMSKIFRVIAWTASVLSAMAILASPMACARENVYGLPGEGADTIIRIDSRRVIREIPPGVVGWGAMWKKSTLWPEPPGEFTDRTHRDYIERLASANLSLISASDTRNISWPWGVSFSTWGVNWENSTGPWSQRKVDCSCFLRHSSGWCEKTIVSVSDLLYLADKWGLEAVTVSVPLIVIDGNRIRWGPNLLTHEFNAPTIEKISDHAVGLIEYMKRQQGWQSVKRVFLSAGCEWRHYKLRNPSSAVLSYARLVKRIREKIKDGKVIVVACASDSTDIPGAKRLQAVSWNKPLYDELHNIDGIALDLHRYRGMMGLTGSSGDKTPMSPENVRSLMKTGASQRDMLAVQPGQWGENGPTMASVLLEIAIHGNDADHSRHTIAPRPWAAAMAHADLVREALASPALTVLGWTWFPEDLPVEWSHGAIKDGKLESHAVAQAFLSRFHRGQLVYSTAPDGDIRGNSTLQADGSLRFYGGNFSLARHHVGFVIDGQSVRGGRIELLSEHGRSAFVWDGLTPITIEPATLFRIEFMSNRPTASRHQI